MDKSGSSVGKPQFHVALHKVQDLRGFVYPRLNPQRGNRNHAAETCEAFLCRNTFAIDSL
jgi:hypothetical protein